MLAIFALERYGAFYSMGWTESLGQSLFYSISLRSAGFFTFNINHLRNASLLLTMTYMFIGASAGSTGGGIKTSTFVVFFATLISIAKGKSFVEIKGRTIPPTQVYKVISVVTMAMMWILVSTFILMLVEPEQSFLHLLFEATSALATTGLSCGITAGLSFLGKTVILLSMLAGRMGSLTFIYAIRQKHEKQPYKYPEEKVVIG
jgi:trk system potassium uptake protein TrkH